MKKFDVLIIGRPNVGKSTLANVFADKGKVITSDIPGTTRDYVELEASWQSRHFNVIDTGGLVTKKFAGLEKKVLDKIEARIKTCDLILFVIDAKNGITSYDREIAKKIKKESDKVVLVLNKLDSGRLFNQIDRFRALGFERMFPVSAISGKGIGDLLDEVVATLEATEKEEDKSFKFAFFGKANVGKSSLTNTLLEKKRVIVSEVPGTTIDMIESTFKFEGQDFTVIDTAGLRRKSKATGVIEKKSQKRVDNILNYIDVACLVIDGSERLSRQDLRVAQVLEESSLPCVIIVNKCDKLCDLETSTGKIASYLKEKKKEIDHRLAVLYFAKTIFVSAKDHYNIEAIPKTILKIRKDKDRNISPNELQEFFKDFLIDYPPRSRRNRKTSTVKGLYQVSSNPLLFGLKVSEKGFLRREYIQLVGKKIYQHFKYFSRPVHIKIVKGKK
ncbi:ribosome biogenesis GTPase Der [Patescibacteria group bacterium]|nr:ribosome biogenesis GTPase Der [Patescibacteria group bacterium]